MTECLKFGHYRITLHRERDIEIVGAVERRLEELVKAHEPLQALISCLEECEDARRDQSRVDGETQTDGEREGQRRCDRIKPIDRMGPFKEGLGIAGQ